MKAVVQRVARGEVKVDGKVRGAVGRGLVVLLGVTHADTRDDARYLAHRTVNLRVFADEEGRMNRSVEAIGGEVLVVSQFTLYADTRKGHRPSFVDAAEPEKAQELYGVYVDALRRALGDGRVATGVFGAHMAVSMVNDGPVTIELRSKGEGGVR